MRKTWFLGIIVMIFLIPSQTHIFASSTSEDEIQNLLKTHLNKYYSIFHGFDIPDYRTSKMRRAIRDRFNNKAKYLNREDFYTGKGIHVGHRTNFQITKIDIDSERVYYKYFFKPNEFGRLLGWKENEYKGMALISKTENSKNYSFGGAFFYSEKEDLWYPTTWTKENSNGTFFCDSTSKRFYKRGKGEYPIKINSNLFSISDFRSTQGSQFTLIVPFDETEFPLITNNPLTFFVFVKHWNVKRINNIKVENLKNGTLLDHNLELSKIDGFDMVNEIKTLSKFDLVDKKNAIIENIRKCYRPYKDEYDQFKGNIYTFLLDHQTSERSRLKGLYDSKKVVVANPLQAKPSYGRKSNFVTIDDYDVDKKVLKSFLFGTDHYGRNITVGWGDCFNMKKYSIPDYAYIDMPINIAKELFGDRKIAYCTTILTVKINELPCRKRSRGVRYDWTGFEILQIDKFFKKTQKTIDYEYHATLIQNPAGGFVQKK